MRLTELSIKNLPLTESGQKRYRDDSLPGFGITVGLRTKTFFVMYGKDRRLKTLGQYPHTSLREARDTAKALLLSKSPIKRSEGLLETKEAYLEDCYRRLKRSTADRYYFALKDIKGNTLEDIDTSVTDPNQIKALKAFYNWCIDHQLTDTNPFIRRKVKFNVRERLLTDDEIVAIWSYDHPPYSDIVKALILSGQRRNQIWKYSTDWKEEEVVTFPSWVMKSNQPHTLPLTSYAHYLHPTSFNSWSKSKRRIDRHTEVTDWVLHDFRRYFSTTMAKLGVPLHITERIIDHRGTVSGVAAVYNRYQFLDEMKEALLQYEDHIATLVKL